MRGHSPTRPRAPIHSDLAVLSEYAAKSEGYLDEVDRAQKAARRLKRQGYAGAELFANIAEFGHDMDPRNVMEDFRLVQVPGGHADAWAWTFHRVHLHQTVEEVRDDGNDTRRMNVVAAFEELVRAADPQMPGRLAAAAALYHETYEDSPEVEADAFALVASIVALR